MSALPAGAKARFFLDVERSVCGRAWHDRLDDRASARALSIVQRHGMPELLARVLAARDVAPEDVEAFLDPTVKRLMPDPDRLMDMGAAAARVRARIGPFLPALVAFAATPGNDIGQVIAAVVVGDLVADPDVLDGAYDDLVPDRVSLGIRPA